MDKPEVILSRMTLEEKARLLCGATSFGTTGIDRLGIPALQLLDGGTGINYEQLFDSCFKAEASAFGGEVLQEVSENFCFPENLSPAGKKLYDIIYPLMLEKTGGITPAPGCYPPGTLLGASWNPDVVRAVGRMLGVEAKVFGVDVLLGTPNVNILREPTNGRFFEGYSEDPYLAKTLSPELVKGVGSEGIAANVKHYAANNLEINRVGIDEAIDLRTLHEIYLPAFEACVKAGVSTLMAAYNSINGVKCTENTYLLKDILRDTWGFDGLVMTDWGACTGPTGTSCASGVDLFMPGPWPHEDIVAAVEDGRLSQEALDFAVLNMLKLIEYCGQPKVKPTEEEYVSSGDKVAYEAACEGIVMLKNDGVLPASPDHIYLFGDGARGFLDHGSGSAQVFTSRTTSLAECLGCPVDDYEAFAADKDGLAVVVCSVQSAEGSDRSDLKLPLEICEILEGLKGKICLILNTPAPVELVVYREKLAAVFAVFYPGMQGARAMADILTGAVNPSGHLPCTFPVRYEDSPAFLNYPSGFKCIYGEEIFVGYRGYQAKCARMEFPFGHGLSYSDFDITATEGPAEVKAGDKIELKITLENVSDIPGKCVVQIYVNDLVATVRKAPNALVSYGKFFLAAHEKKTVTLTVDTDEFKWFDNDLKKFLIEDGYYNLRVGFSCEDIRAAHRVYLTGGSEELAAGPSWPVGWIADAPELAQALEEDFKVLGIDRSPYIGNLRYTPSYTLEQTYPDTAEFKNFLEACRTYRRP